MDFTKDPKKKTLLWVGDAGVPSGFGLATHKILDVLLPYYNIVVLAINYHGDADVQAQYPYPLYSCTPGGDYLGVGRIVWMCDKHRPDVIVLQNDPWNIQPYLKHLRVKRDDGSYYWPQHAKIPVVGIVAVDGKNCAGDYLNGLALAIFWTQFAMDEAKKGGYTGPSAVVPLGVDTNTFYPVDKRGAIARKLLGPLAGKFVVGNVNRNQPRKRWDLTLRYFANWIYGDVPFEERDETNFRIDNAYLFLHVAPTGDMGIDVKQLASYYKVLSRLALHHPPMWVGDSQDELRDTYNIFDVLVSTTQGEGFGLTALEAMACEVPCILPDWSALGEWARDAAILIPCTSTAITTAQIGPSAGVIGGVPDEEIFIQQLDLLYRNRTLRSEIAAQGFKRAHEDRFHWSQVGDSVRFCLNFALSPPEEAPKVEEPVQA